MDPTNDLAVTVSKLRPIWFSLVQNETPEGLDRDQTEQQLIEFAKELVVMEKIKPEDVQEVLAEEDYNQRIIDLIELITKGAYGVKDENFNSRLKELVSKYEEHKKQLQQQAEAEKAKHPDPRQQTEKIIAALQQTSAHLKDNPQASEGFEKIKEDVSSGLVNSPEKTIPAATEYVVHAANDPTYKEVDASLHLSPLVDPAQIYSQKIDTLVTAVEVILPPELPEPTKLEIAQSFVAFKLAKPNATPDEYQSLVEKIELRVAAEQQIAVTIPPETPQVVAAAKIDISAKELVKQTIQVKLQQSGIPVADSEHAAQIITNFAPAIHYVSGFAPKTGKGYEQNKKEVTQKLTNHVVERLLSSPGSPRAILQTLRNATSQFDFYRLYSDPLVYGPAQFYQYQPQVYEFPTHPEVATHDPYLTYLYSYGKSYAQDAVVNVALDLAVDGPLGIWILPNDAIASAFVFDDMLTGVALSGATEVGTIGVPLAAGVEVTVSTVPATTAIASTIPAGTAVGAELAAGAAAGATAAAGTAAATGAAAGATGAAASTGILATINTFLTATLGPIGVAIAAFLTTASVWVATHWKQISKFFKDNSRAILTGIATGIIIAVTAALVGLTAIGVAAVGLVGVAAGVMLAPQVAGIISGGASGVLQGVGQGAGHVFASITTLAVVEIATPIVIIIMSIPIVVALLLFIINSSAYVVPSSSPFSGGSSSLGPGGQYPSCWPTNSGSISQGPPVPIGAEGYTVCTERDANGVDHTVVCSHVSPRLNAIDIGVPNDTAVYATHDGIATTHDWTIEDTHGYGNLVTVASTDGTFVSYYGHLNSFSVASGASVTAGTQIALSDNTGNSTGPHVHYELRRLGSAPAPIDLCTYPNGLINSCVPDYTVLAPISGCLASSSGGNANFISPTP